MKAQPVIIVGRNRANNFFYMVNNNQEEGGPWYQGSKDENKVRKVVNPRIYPSKLRAKKDLSTLKKECYTAEWWTESVYE